MSLSYLKSSKIFPFNIFMLALNALHMTGSYHSFGSYLFPLKGGTYDFIEEFMKVRVDMADMIGLHLLMSQNADKGSTRVAALGWATATANLYPPLDQSLGIQVD